MLKTRDIKKHLLICIFRSSHLLSNNTLKSIKFAYVLCMFPLSEVKLITLAETKFKCLISSCIASIKHYLSSNMFSIPIYWYLAV